jgi:hypothetical protein
MTVLHHITVVKCVKIFENHSLLWTDRAPEAPVFLHARSPDLNPLDFLVGIFENPKPMATAIETRGTVVSNSTIYK